MIVRFGLAAVLRSWVVRRTIVNTKGWILHYVQNDALGRDGDWETLRQRDEETVRRRDFESCQLFYDCAQ